MIERHFSPDDVNEVRAALLSITLDHVMARSETNLFNARRAVLNLSKGELDKVRHYAKRAKEDFRDVIYWEGLENDARP
mgnify:FL=1